MIWGIVAARVNPKLATSGVKAPWRLLLVVAGRLNRSSASPR